MSLIRLRSNCNILMGRLQKCISLKQCMGIIICVVCLSIILSLNENHLKNDGHDNGRIQTHTHQSDIKILERQYGSPQNSSLHCSFSDRKSLVRETCGGIKHSRAYEKNINYDRKMYQKFLVDKHHKIIYCEVPKAGCTTMKTILAQASGHLLKRNCTPGVIHNKTVLDECELQFLQEFSIAEIKTLLDSKDYTKVIVVRHPMERIISAYEDKFIFHTFSEELNKYIISKFRTMNETATPDRPSFDEFVQYVTSHYPKLRISKMPWFNPVSFAYDGHWRKIHDLCHPCHIEYDYIMKLETLQKDIKVLFDMLKGDLNSRDLPQLNRTVRKSGQLKLIARLPAKIRDKLFDFYKNDMKMFGYQMSKDFTPQCENVSDKNEICC